MSVPRVSVLMSTYNTPNEWLSEAIESILNQTFSNFEFIIVDDCSNNGVDEVKKKYLDERIIWVHNEENLGLTKSLNKALKLAKGEYIARMDADDISVPERFEIQVAYMDAHPDIIVSGSYRRAFGKENKDEVWNLPATREEQQVQLFFFNCGVTHPTAMLRKSMLDEFGITYNEKYKKAQDYGLWVQCTRYAPMAMIPKVLLKYRKSNQQISSAGRMSQRENSRRVKLDQLKALSIEATEKEKVIHIALCSNDTNIAVEDMERWVRKICEANKNMVYFNYKIFEKELDKRWYTWCKKAYKSEGKTDAKEAYKKARQLVFLMQDIEMKMKIFVKRILKC